jgi:Kef-type K+ transport system membrane component KefB
VGVEATVPQMLRTGLSAVLVAVIGVVAPLALGALLSWLFFPQSSGYAHVFVGSILCATSVGLTARVLRDLGRTRTPEARLILGAAVIDDVLGLLILATVSGLITAADAGTTMGPWRVLTLVGQAVLFLGIAIPVGLWLAPRMFRLATSWKSKGLLLPASLAFCFLLSYLSTLVGLAPIVGAFTAGLILEDVQFEELATRERRSLEDLLQPLTSLLLPVFFVLIGMKVDASRFGDPQVLIFAAALTAAAVVGKLACSLGVMGSVDRWTVGIGMVPRGEVGFIFAGIGTTLEIQGSPIVPPAVFAAVVLVVIVTTLATPPALSWRLKGVRRRSANGEGADVAAAFGEKWREQEDPG